jgi:hypothetical protein
MEICRTPFAREEGDALCMPLRVGLGRTALGRKGTEEGRVRIGRMPGPSTRRSLGFLRRTASVSCQRDRSMSEGQHLIGPSEDFRAVTHREHRVKSSPPHRRPVGGEKLALRLAVQLPVHFLYVSPSHHYSLGVTGNARCEACGWKGKDSTRLRTPCFAHRPAALSDGGTAGH